MSVPTRKRPGRAVKGILEAMRGYVVEDPEPGGPVTEYIVGGPRAVLHEIECVLEDYGYELPKPIPESELTPEEVGK